MADCKPLSPTIRNICMFDAFIKEQQLYGLIPTKSSKASIEFRKQGNELFTKRHHTETASHRKILSLYSQSAAYAPNNSEELASALNNRSALWLHLRKYDLCLVDIKRSMSITSSSALKNKLLSRQMKCLDLNQSNPSNHSKKSKLPKVNQSKVVSCAADCVKLEFNEKFGRHYIATRDIEPGEIVFSEKTLYAHVKLSQIYLFCSHCLAFVWAGIPCDSCVFAMYCSDRCKEEAWSQYHDIHCPILSSLNCESLKNCNWIVTANLAKAFIIMIRREGLKNVMEEAEKIDNQKGLSLDKLLFNNKLDCKKFRSVYDLAKSQKSDQIKDEISMVLSLSGKFLVEQCRANQYEIDFEVLLTSMETILIKLEGIRETNSYKFQSSICSCDEFNSCDEDCISKTGSILAPCSSLLNHSCDQNLSRMCLPGPQIVLFTLRPVKKGEQIFTSYGPGARMAREDRREYLQKNFEFICDCKACHENWSTPPRMPSLSELQQLWSKSPKALARTCMMILDTPPEKWLYSKESLKDATKMVSFIHKNLDDQDAYVVGEPFRAYIDRSFFHLYGENINFPDTC